MTRATTDYAALRTEHRQRLIDADPTKEQLLDELRLMIETNKEALPAYRRVQDAARYNMTVEDIDDQEQRYVQFKNDRLGIYGKDEHIDALVDANATAHVIINVIKDHRQGGSRSVLQRRFSTGWLVLAAIIIFVVARSCSG